MDEPDILHQLETLTQLPGPVGREHLVQAYMEEQLSRHTSHLVRDRVGNLTAHFPGEGVKTVVAAHACEVGFIVSGITHEGFLRIAPNYKTRSVDTRILPFHRVTLLTDTYERVEGVFTIDTGHVVPAETRTKAPSLQDLLVDVGASSPEEVNALNIDVGCPLTWDVPFKKMGNRLKGKAMDDRLGLVLLLSLAEFLSEQEPRREKRDLYLTSTVQEEIGVRGARALASQYTFDEAIVLEITPTSRSGNLTLGEGPALVYKDSSMHYHHPTLMECKRIAQKRGIPLQPAILERGMTDGLGFFVQSASRVVLLGCPTLYPHSPGETIDIRDLCQLDSLLHHMVQRSKK